MRLLDASGRSPDRHRDDEAGPDRQARAPRSRRPRPWEGVPAAGLDQVRRDDADDERGFEALAKHQEERGGHGTRILGGPAPPVRLS